MSLVSYSAVEKFYLHTDPYAWYAFPNIISDELKQELYLTYPSESFIRSYRLDGDRKNYSFSILKLYSKTELIHENFNTLSAIWKAFILELCSPSYYMHLCNTLNISSNDCYIDIALYRYTKGDWTTTHVDSQSKVLSHLFYFNNYWHDYWGGQLYLSSTNSLTNMSKSILPNEITALALKRFDNAWHGVLPVTQSAKADRLCLQYEVWSKL